MQDPGRGWCRVLLAGGVLILSASAWGIRMVQNGFVLHEPDGVELRISNARSGPICADMQGQLVVCQPDTAILVTGADTCIGTDDQEYPCTRYGYRYDYSGASPGSAIHCESTRRDPFRSRSMEYSLTLDGEVGSVFQPSWIPFSKVERRTMLTEVHRCRYQGKPLATIEFIVSYEPDTKGPNTIGTGTSGADRGPAPGVDEPYLAEIPGACERLQPSTIEEILGTHGMQAEAGSEHVPGLSSRCAYSAAGRSVGQVFKFMPYEMFDLDALNSMQVAFNVSMFAGASVAPTHPSLQLGKATFAFDEAGRSTLVIVTGIQGPVGGGGRAREFLTAYYLSDASRPHEERLSLLLGMAETHFEEWPQP